MPADVTRTGADWIADFAAALGVDAPDEDTVATLLEVASVAAHASERVAAPIACWLIGRAGAAPDHGLATARSINP